jgi:hypothetical protein
LREFHEALILYRHELFIRHVIRPSDDDDDNDDDILLGFGSPFRYAVMRTCRGPTNVACIYLIMFLLYVKDFKDVCCSLSLYVLHQINTPISDYVLHL